MCVCLHQTTAICCLCKQLPHVRNGIEMQSKAVTLWCPARRFYWNCFLPYFETYGRFLQHYIAYDNTNNIMVHLGESNSKYYVINEKTELLPNIKLSSLNDSALWGCGVSCVISCAGGGGSKNANIGSSPAALPLGGLIKINRTQLLDVKNDTQFYICKLSQVLMQVYEPFSRHREVIYFICYIKYHAHMLFIKL